MFDLFFIAFSHLIAPKIRREMWQPTPVQLQLLGGWRRKIRYIFSLAATFCSTLRLVLGRCVSSPPRDAAREEEMCCRWKIEQTHDEEERKFSYISFRPASLSLFRYCEFPSICFVIFSMINSHQILFTSIALHPQASLAQNVSFILPHDMFPSLNPNLHPQFFFHLFSEPWKKVQNFVFSIDDVALLLTSFLCVFYDTPWHSQWRVGISSSCFNSPNDTSSNSTSSSCRQQQLDDGTWGRDDDNKHSKAMIMTMRRTKNPKQRRISTLQKLKVIIII